MGLFKDLFKRKVTDCSHCGAAFEIVFETPGKEPEWKFVRCPNCSLLSIATKGYDSGQKAIIDDALRDRLQQIRDEEKLRGEPFSNKEMGEVLKQFKEVVRKAFANSFHEFIFANAPYHVFWTDDKGQEQERIRDTERDAIFFAQSKAKNIQKTVILTDRTKPGRTFGDATPYQMYYVRADGTIEKFPEGKLF